MRGPLSWLLPEGHSTYAGGVDGIYYLILGITGLIFVVVEGALVYFLIRYRRREGRNAAYVHGNVAAEVLWTVVPFVIVLFLALMSRNVWKRVKDPASFPEDALVLEVRAKQFEWNVTYPGPDGELGTGDDFVRRNQLHLPANRPVVLRLTSEDVIHSLFIRELRVKQDAVPGMEIPVWFEATRPGRYTLGCAELCGLGHYRMRASVEVHTPEGFEAWQRAEALAGRVPAQEGGRALAHGTSGEEGEGQPAPPGKEPARAGSP